MCGYASKENAQVNVFICYDVVVGFTLIYLRTHVCVCARACVCVSVYVFCLYCIYIHIYIEREQ